MNESEPTESREPGDQQISSLDLFHEAQQAAMDRDRTVAVEKLEESLASAEAETEPDVEWIAYIQGTLSYLREDLTGLRDQIVNAGENAYILSRLATGLERRGTCDYQEDYSG